ncbi:MAG: CoA-binding protein [Thermoplasmata archaeon]|nr:MAG: CoA-binding protein [Thermoplasmata archaeon]HDJ26923.1 CoA-binding protein [Aciduliprofundum sp.]
MLERLLNPRTIAVVGASHKPGKVGHEVLRNLINYGFPGKIYPVNPKGGEILGLRVYRSLLEVPDEVDLAVIVVPARIVPSVVEDAGRKGVKALAIITSGFSETGPEGAELERRIVETARRYGMRILGPNIVGIMSTSKRINATFSGLTPYPGSVTIISQSGALLIAMAGRTWIEKVGINDMISIGNMSDITFPDLLQYYYGDESTKVIGLYIEGLKKGREFIEVARRANKPIVALKAGVSRRGALAAASHTGSLAGSAAVYRGAFRQARVVWANDLDDFFDKMLVLSLLRPPENGHVLIITNGGGVGVLSTDEAERQGIELEDPPKDLKEELRKYMPEFGSDKNPVDLTGMATDKEYYGTVSAALSHPWVGALVVLFCETALTSPQKVADAIVRAYDDSGRTKPIVVSFVGGPETMKAADTVKERGIPIYKSPELALRALAGLMEYARILKKGEPEFRPFGDVDRERVRRVLDAARAEGRSFLLEHEAKEVLEAYGVPVARTRVASSPEEAVALARETGLPVVMKIVSPDIVHKSDAGGVFVGVRTEEEVRETFNKIVENAKKYKPDARIVGVTVQELAPQGLEVIVGATRDPQFGPVVAFGLGGVMVEALKDVSFRVAPVTPEDAEEMVREIKARDLLGPFRGQKPRDVGALKEVISRISQLVTDFPEISELDANPVMLYGEGEGLKVVDARIILA